MWVDFSLFTNPKKTDFCPAALIQKIPEKKQKGPQETESSTHACAEAEEQVVPAAKKKLRPSQQKVGAAAAAPVETHEIVYEQLQVQLVLEGDTEPAFFVYSRRLL